MTHNISSKRELAQSNFCAGYNCTQAVVLSFKDELCSELNINENTLLKLASSFGGGMGRLREVCGAVSGMFMIAGFLYGYTSPDDKAGKTEHYKRIQELAEAFKKKNGSIVCRELLQLRQQKDIPVPDDRTPEYYATRPCERVIGDAAAIIDAYIQERKNNESHNKPYLR